MLAELNQPNKDLAPTEHPPTADGFRGHRSRSEDFLALVDGVDEASNGPGVWIFGAPVDLIEARTPAELEIACAAIDRATRSFHVLLMIDYEVGAWFEPKLALRSARHPWAPFQAWIFEEATWMERTEFERQLDESLNESDRSPAGVADLHPELREQEYVSAVEAALEQIRNGNIYQVNLTWRIDFTFFGSALALYSKLRRFQPVNYGGCLILPDRTLLSLSPELFLKRQGQTLTARPMKGTRATEPESDRMIASALQQSEKDRAENLMIVDLLRNDLGKIAATGSVRVDQLFAIESYPTVHQMVSQVSANVPDRSLCSALRALFPCGSVTGAPKIRAMQIINQLEGSARGIYTGSIGHIRPGGDFMLNVAIRTIELSADKRGFLHIGSGIVADSSAQSEYSECWSKARFLTEIEPGFALIETILLERSELIRISAHLRRLKESAAFFGFKYHEAEIRKSLNDAVRIGPGTRCRVRLTLEKTGQTEVQVQPLADLPESVSVTLAVDRVDSKDLFLRHKTTARARFDDALHHLKTHPNYFDVLFVNERGELTEGARTNLFLLKNLRWFTPSTQCGLLNGVARQEVLGSRPVKETRLYVDDLLNADAIYLSNALRGLFRVWFRPLRGPDK
jgi:para-aminobenzoate synthetase / 4-amino-4-deoxychorismate lyase